MIWILATRGASTKLRATPFTETAIEGVHSVAYKSGVASVPLSGADAAGGSLGTFGRGVGRISGVVLSYSGTVAETLLDVGYGIDLIIKYRANAQKRKRTLVDVVFVGDATVMFPSKNAGAPELIAVPFRVQMPEGDTLTAHVIDSVDE